MGFEAKNSSLFLWYDFDDFRKTKLVVTKFLRSHVVIKF